MKLTAKSIFIGLAIAGPFAIGLVGCSSSGDTSGTAGTASTSGTASDSGAASSSTTGSSTAGTATSGETAGKSGSSASSATSGGTADATNGSTGTQPADGSDTGAKGETAMAGAVKFADIQKAFSANCMGCHSGPHPAHQLDLSSYESVMKGDKEGAVVVAGNPDKSRLFEAISHDPGVAAMPKGKPKLDSTTIKAVHDWIMAGAKKD